MPFLLPEASSRREHLSTQILYMLGKGAIERVEKKFSPGFYSLLFVTPKRKGTFQLLIVLRSLDHHLTKEKFHMETTANLHHSVQEWDWLISLALTDVYLHVQIHSSSRNFLHRGLVFLFCVLPYGLSVSPGFLTHIVDAIIDYVRSLGLAIHHFLDDWLLRNQQVGILRTQTQCPFYLSDRLGWTPTLEKQELSPTQDPVFIGTLNQTDGADVLRGGRIQKSSQSC